MKKPIAAILILLAMLPAAARPWKPQGPVLAQDYSVITDNRNNREMVEIFWMTWPMTGGSSQVLHDLLDHYVIVGVGHGRLDAGGQMVFDKEESAQAFAPGGVALKPVAEKDLPPAVEGVVVSMGSFMRKSVGALGEGMSFKVFESGAVRACEKGQLSLQYAGETYTYDTPIPGCPAP